MPDLDLDLTAFMADYERANNDREIGRVTAAIADDATYWFSDGTHRGVDEIGAAIERTFATIQDETYEIQDLEWVVISPDSAVCRYRFSWTGLVDGERRSGSGRGTNVVVRRDGTWQILHEHLSA
ncbi:MAG TPA: nuclear transport factor 2 family protein [Nocardioidaceae bacterium]|nr:nuclear transport factor 2 family protein [Nocardioidaceae bacterium]